MGPAHQAVKVGHRVPGQVVGFRQHQVRANAAVELPETQDVGRLGAAQRPPRHPVDELLELVPRGFPLGQAIGHAHDEVTSRPSALVDGWYSFSEEDPVIHGAEDGVGGRVRPATRTWRGGAGPAAPPALPSG